MPRVVVSAGHTSQKPGTIVNGVKEVDINRKIAKEVVGELRSNGVLTLAVPYDLELAQKINWINNTGYTEDNNDICIEIHSNESDGNKSGLEIWYSSGSNNKSQTLSEKIINNASKESGLKNQGAFSEKDHELGGLAFVHNTNPIGVLMECGYMDNVQDQAFFADEGKIKILARGIAKGVLEFLNIEYKDNKKTKVKPNNNIQNQSQIQNNNQQDTPQNLPVMNNSSQGNVNNNSKNNDTGFRPMTNNNSKSGNQSRNFGNVSPPSMTAAKSNTGSGGNSSSGGGSYLANREKRKEMIKDHYIKILGREPNQSDLNYFLNIGINEDQLIKKMMESQEHADLVKSRQEVLEVKGKFHAQQAELITLRAENQDKAELMQHFQRLIAQKNQALTQLQYRVSQLEQYINTSRSTSNISPSGPRYNESFMERLFKFFSDRLG